MVNFGILCFVILFLLNPYEILTQISDKRLCANENCTEPISLAFTILNYRSDDINKLSLPQHVEVTVYSKSAGSNAKLWGVEYQGKRGYVDKEFLRESKMLFKKKLKFLVDTDQENVPSPTINVEDISSSKDKFEVIDGTTIYLSPDEINPSSIEESVKPTKHIPLGPSKFEEKSDRLEEIDKTKAENTQNKEDSMFNNVLSSISNFLDVSSDKAFQEQNDKDSEEDDDEELDDDDESEYDEDLGESVENKKEDQSLVREDLLTLKNVRSTKDDEKILHKKEKIESNEETLHSEQQKIEKVNSSEETIKSVEETAKSSKEKVSSHEEEINLSEGIGNFGEGEVNSEQEKVNSDEENVAYDTEKVNSDEEKLSSGEEKVNLNEDINSGEEEINSDEEKASFIGAKVNSNEETVVNSDEEKVSSGEEKVNLNEDINSGEEEINSDEEKASFIGAKVNSNEETVVNSDEEKVSSGEEKVNLHENINSGKEEINSDEGKASFIGAKVNSNEETVVNSDEETVSSDKGIANFDEGKVNSEENVSSDEERVNSDDEKVSSDEGKVKSHEENANFDEGNIISSGKNVNSGEEKVNSNEDNANASEEKGLFDEENLPKPDTVSIDNQTDETVIEQKLENGSNNSLKSAIIPDEESHQNILEFPLTTETVLDISMDDGYNGDFVTPNPGKLEETPIASSEESEDPVQNNENLSSNKQPDLNAENTSQRTETIEIIEQPKTAEDPNQNTDYWSLGFVESPKPIIGNIHDTYNKLRETAEQSEEVIMDEDYSDDSLSHLNKFDDASEILNLELAPNEDTKETGVPNTEDELLTKPEQPKTVEEITNISNDKEQIEESSTESVQEQRTKNGGFSGIYNNWFGGPKEGHPDGVYEEQGSKNVEETTDAAPLDNDVINESIPEQIETHHHVWTSSHIEDQLAGGVETKHDVASGDPTDHASCPVGGTGCPSDILASMQKQLEMEDVISALDFDFADMLNLFVVLSITGVSVVIFLLGYITIDKSRREGPLIAKINNLEKALLVAAKENQILLDKITDGENESALENDRISNEAYEALHREYQAVLQTKAALEEQVQSLEKELENSTEVGMELNRMLSDMLTSQNGSDTLIANVEQLQRQLIEQQRTINTIDDSLNLKDTENHELQLELEIKNKKVIDLQVELDKMALNLLKTEEDKDLVQIKLENELQSLKDQASSLKITYGANKNKLVEEINSLKKRCTELGKSLELKTNEYNILKDNFNKIRSVKDSSETLQSLLDVTTIKAEFQQLQTANKNLSDLLYKEQQIKYTLENQTAAAVQEMQQLRIKYDDADREKFKAQTKLEVLSNYFKEKEGELQRELSKQESLWVEKQGETSSTTERIKFIQEELFNCKSQNESLKQEIVSQEVELKSQISVLEKKAHESWVSARQAERRLEEAKQEAAQLRNRLTLKERGFNEDKSQNRIQSPMELQNGEVPISPLHMQVDSPTSPLLFGGRDHLTTSPPIPGLPPFLPPPPGVPFIPPPMGGVPGFMPPPPSMFPVDHRPPPLGRMSSPPLNSRYSPDSRYSPYERNSPSPPYDDEYGSSSPPMRGYSPYNGRDDRRDYKRPPPPIRINGRNKGVASSGSEHSNESLERTTRHHTKI